MTYPGDLAAVGGDGEGVRDDEDPDAPGEGGPDAAADRVLREQVVDRVDDGRDRLVVGEARTGPGMVRVGTNAELMNGRKMSG